MSAATAQDAARRDRINAPSMRAPRLGPGQRMRLLRYLAGEDSAAATTRAQRMPWWSTVVRPRPTWSGGHWIFIARV